MAVRVVLRKDETVVEIHEMRCVDASDSVDQESVRAEVAEALRMVALMAGTGDAEGLEASVEVGGEEVHGMRRVPSGIVRAGVCEIRCAVFLADEA